MKNGAEEVGNFFGNNSHQLAAIGGGLLSMVGGGALMIGGGAGEVVGGIMDGTGVLTAPGLALNRQDMRRGTKFLPAADRSLINNDGTRECGPVD